MSRSLWKGPFIDFSLIKKTDLAMFAPSYSAEKGDLHEMKIDPVAVPRLNQGIVSPAQLTRLRQLASPGQLIGEARSMNNIEQDQQNNVSVSSRFFVGTTTSIGETKSRKPTVPMDRLHRSDVIKVWSRRSIILPEFLNQKFEIHNGKNFVPLHVNEEMIGHKFGEFSSTRKKTIHKKKLTKK